MSEEPLRGAPPNWQDIAWLELMHEARKTSLKSLDDAAKQLIGIVPILSGLYAAALGLAKIKPEYWQANDSARFFFAAPILILLITLIAAVAAFFPQAYTYNPHSPDDARDAYNQIVAAKHTRLKWAMGFLVLSLLALLAAVWTYLGVLASGLVTT